VTTTSPSPTPAAVPGAELGPLVRADYRPGQAHPLDREQVAAYVNDGFLVAPGLLSAQEITAINAEIPLFARGAYPAVNPQDLPPQPDELDDAEAMNGLLAVHQPHWVNDTIRATVTHPVLGDVLGQLVGAHLPGWDGRVKCMQSMLFVKPPGLPGQAWHQDEHYIPTRDRSLCGAWIALDDADVHNGCLWVVPGSHLRGYLYPTRAHGNDEYDRAEEAFDNTDADLGSFDEHSPVPVAVRAGDVVFFNGYLLHKSLKNRSTTSYRRALVNHYANAWTTLPWDLAAGGGTTGPDDFRIVVPVTGLDPYAWKGYGHQPALVYIRPHT
jgi:phytanoyl-CoA hydroxylase